MIKSRAIGEIRVYSRTGDEIAITFSRPLFVSNGIIHIVVDGDYKKACDFVKKIVNVDRNLFPFVKVLMRNYPCSQYPRISGKIKNVKSFSNR